MADEGLKLKFMQGGSRYAINGEAEYVAPTKGQSYSGQTTSVDEVSAAVDGLAGKVDGANSNFPTPSNFTSTRLEGANGLASIPIPENHDVDPEGFGNGFADSETSNDYF
jgi:hypothetical protein|tara:strand:- start:1193 stop:1522 length:330 start_codon:yes stop_codon:yes gene_type:complete